MDFWNRKLKMWHILVILLICVAVYFAACHNRRSKEETKTTPVAEQKSKIVKDSAETKRVLDSMTKITNDLQSWINDLNKDRKVLMSDMSIQSDIINDLLNTREGTEDEADYKKELQTRINDLVATYGRKDSNCDSIILLKDAQLMVKDQQLSAKDTLYSKLRASADTCFKGLTAAQKANKKANPNLKVAAGPVVNVYPDAGIGVGISFIMNKMVIDVDMLRMNKSWYYQGGVKFVISLR